MGGLLITSMSESTFSDISGYTQRIFSKSFEKKKNPQLSPYEKPKPRDLKIESLDGTSETNQLNTIKQSDNKPKVGCKLKDK